jgi:hypothetical protein
MAFISPKAVIEDLLEQSGGDPPECRRLGGGPGKAHLNQVLKTITLWNYFFHHISKKSSQKK